MLISHPFQFIFIKTVKTAGTSIEGFLEPYCTLPGHVVQHHTPTLISPYGVVARRGTAHNQLDEGYNNHMSATEVQKRCSFFDQYKRLTVVRDPYDKLVSYFHFRAVQTNGRIGLGLSEASALFAAGEEGVLQHIFLSFLQQEPLPIEQPRLCLQGKLAVQRWLRFENLLSDLEDLVADWQLPLQAATVAEQLPNFKRLRNHENHTPPLDAYLSAAAIELINGVFEWDFRTFAYPMRTPHSCGGRD